MSSRQGNLIGSDSAYSRASNHVWPGDKIGKPEEKRQINLAGAPGILRPWESPAGPEVPQLSREGIRTLIQLKPYLHQSNTLDPAETEKGRLG